jgi:SAM-dependent methyltransferase
MAHHQPDSPTLSFRGYDIPCHLIEKTGAGPETFADFSNIHMQQLERYAPVDPGHAVLEIGCGIGRDAIPLVDVLSDDGRYDGIDIDAESIEWCQQNITTRHPNFRFHYFDIRNKLYNPMGRVETAKVSFPVSDRSVDRIVAQSVFTHLPTRENLRYLQETARVLRPDGLAMVTFFLGTVDEIHRSLENTVSFFRFPHDLGDGCFLCDRDRPEISVAYTNEALERLLQQSGLEMAQPVDSGNWISRPDGGPHGQDIVVLRPRTSSEARVPDTALQN